MIPRNRKEFREPTKGGALSRTAGLLSCSKLNNDSCINPRIIGIPGYAIKRIFKVNKNDLIVSIKHYSIKGVVYSTSSKEKDYITLRMIYSYRFRNKNPSRLTRNFCGRHRKTRFYIGRICKEKRT